eukprot:TRINITY_DN19567_c0_g1_i1.p1 TRINITY_DN19567_c0_g1~~TRINITY_DN19567_c0_g1_i1.p1  ORF type:complete len:319 (+),score=119.49 TRINITY_DN19567_c0_g1_i1:109-957(+)
MARPIAQQELLVQGFRMFSATMLLRAEEEKPGVFSRLKSFFTGSPQTQTPQPPQQTPVAAEQIIPQTKDTVSTKIPPPRTISPTPSPPPQKKLEIVNDNVISPNADLGNIGKQMEKTLPASDWNSLMSTLAKPSFDLTDYRLYLLHQKRALDASKSSIPGVDKYRKMQDMKKAAEEEAQSTTNEIRIKIIEAMTPEEKKDPHSLLHRAFKPKQRISTASGASLQDINRMMDNYLWTEAIMKRLYTLRKEGKQIPGTMQGVMQLIQETGGLPKESQKLLRNRR